MLKTKITTLCVKREKSNTDRNKNYNNDKSLRKFYYEKFNKSAFLQITQHITNSSFGCRLKYFELSYENNLKHLVITEKEKVQHKM